MLMYFGSILANAKLYLWRWATVWLDSSGDQITVLGPPLAWHWQLLAIHTNRGREALSGGCNDNSWFSMLMDAYSHSRSHSAVRASCTAQTTVCLPLLTEEQWTRKKRAPKCFSFCTYAPTCFSFYSNVPSWELYFIKAPCPKDWLPLVQIANNPVL